MKVCRFKEEGGIFAGIYRDDHILPIPDSENPVLLDFLPGGNRFGEAVAIHESDSAASISSEQIQLLVPVPNPPKLFLLAGNYAKHIEEGGEPASERADTFPYVFMKPPSTTLTDPGSPFRIPRVSPGHIDWELELGVVIGKGGKYIDESEALNHVAGYTIFNDISDRKFRPNPDRKERPKDKFFDWLHGKWHDSSCPCGPCIASSHTLKDPQNLAMHLSVNGKVYQDASTSQQVFPVAAVVAFISSFVTLEPGDMISTGTAAGVGRTTETFLKPGDGIEASIEGIGTLVTPVEAEF